MPLDTRTSRLWGARVTGMRRKSKGPRVLSLSRG